MPVLSRIAIYPLKSFPPVHVEQARILASGSLEHDRRFALIDSNGKFIHAKRMAAVHRLPVQVDPQARTVSIAKIPDDGTEIFEMDSQRLEIERRFSDYFAMSVRLIENSQTGFPDDPEAVGPTIVSNASFRKVSEWFSGMPLDEVRGRFRVNLEIADAEPFWEDRLFNTADQGDRLFRIGDVLMGGSNPCQRCVVPTRNPVTGDVWPEFARRFSDFRESQLPAWAARDRFDHFYRLTVNTRLIDPGQGMIRIGDPVELVL